MNFESELQMSNLFKEFIFENILSNEIQYLEEVKGLFGIPDLVLVENNDNTIINVLSIELKLKNWKKALSQAFKYKNFSNQSLVLIDESNINVVLKNIDLFKKFNIGLASFNINKIFKIYYNPLIEIPYSDFYRNKFFNTLSDYNLIEKNFCFSNLLNITNKFIFNY